MQTFYSVQTEDNQVIGIINAGGGISAPLQKALKKHFKVNHIDTDLIRQPKPSAKFSFHIEFTDYAGIGNQVKEKVTLTPVQLFE